MAAIEAEFPGLLECVVAEGKPRSGSFEISLLFPSLGTKSPLVIWSGLKKGPPRRLKFPEVDVIIAAIRSALPSA